MHSMIVLDRISIGEDHTVGVKYGVFHHVDIIRCLYGFSLLMMAPYYPSYNERGYNTNRKYYPYGLIFHKISPRRGSVSFKLIRLQHRTQL